MKIDSPEDLFHHDLKDLYDAEHQIEEALGKMEKAAKSQDLKKAFREHRARPRPDQTTGEGVRGIRQEAEPQEV
jgi:ferritin-like metal-binding protein YciE